MEYCCEKFKDEYYYSDMGGAIKQNDDSSWKVVCDKYLVFDKIHFCPFCGSKLPGDRK